MLDLTDSTFQHSQTSLIFVSTPCSLLLYWTLQDKKLLIRNKHSSWFCNIFIEKSFYDVVTRSLAKANLVPMLWNFLQP